MAFPYPQITFKVVTVDYVQLNQRLLPDDNPQNVIDQLAEATVWMPYWPWPLKNGEYFTLYGSEAVKLYQMIPQLNTTATLETVYIGPPLDQTNPPQYIAVNSQQNMSVVPLFPATNGYDFQNTPATLSDVNIGFTQTDSNPQIVFTTVTNNSSVPMIVNINGTIYTVTTGQTFTNTTVLGQNQTVKITSQTSGIFTQGLVFGTVAIAPLPSPTATPLFSATPTPTPSGTGPTATPTQSPSNTASPTPTRSPSPTPTGSPTNTPSPTNSPSNSPSPTPSSTPIVQPQIVAFGYNQGIEIWSGDAGATYQQKNPGTMPWYDVTYNSDLDEWTAVTTTGKIFYSLDGVNWNQVYSNTNYSWRDVCFGYTYLSTPITIVVDYNGNVSYSTDNRTWSTPVNLTIGNLKSCVYSNGNFVILPANGTRTMRSSNGVTWTAGANLPASGGWNGAASDPNTNRIVGVLYGSTTAVYSDNYGATWTTTTLPSATTWENVVFDGSNFVAAASQGAGGVAVSADGATWTAGTNPAPMFALAEYSGTVIGYTYASTNSYTSNDSGATWTPVTLPTAGNWVAAAGKNIVVPPPTPVPTATVTGTPVPSGTTAATATPVPSSTAATPTPSPTTASCLVINLEQYMTNTPVSGGYSFTTTVIPVGDAAASVYDVFCSPTSVRMVGTATGTATVYTVIGGVPTPYPFTDTAFDQTWTLNSGDQLAIYIAEPDSVNGTVTYLTTTPTPTVTAATPTPSVTASQTPTPTASNSPSPTPSGSPSPTPSDSPSPTPSESPTPSPSPTPSDSPSPTPSESPTPSPSPSPSESPTPSPSPSESPTPSPSPTPSESPTPSPSPSESPTPSPSPSPSESPTPSPSPSESPTPSPSPTPSESPTPSPSPSESPTPSPSPTPSESPTPSPSPSESPTPSPSPSPSESPTPSPSPSESPTPSPSPTPSDSPSPTPSDSPSPTPSESPTPSPSPSPSESPTPSPSLSESPTPSPSPTPSESPTPSPSPTPSESPTPSPSPSESPTPSPSPSPSESPTPSPSPSESPSPTPSDSPSPTPSESPTGTPTSSVTASPTPTPSVTITPFICPTDSMALDATSVLSVNLVPNMQLGTGDFTIEWFQYLQQGGGTSPTVFAIGDSNSQLSIGFYFVLNGTNYDITLTINNANYVIGSVAEFDLYRWNYMSLVREAGVFTFYLGGDAFGDAIENVDPITNSASVLGIGNQSATAGIYTFNGNLTNLRWTVGTALYTANYTRPVAPLTAVSGTTLLMACQDSGDITKDTSGYNQTVNATNVIAENCSGVPPTATIAPSPTPTIAPIICPGGAMSFTAGQNDYASMPSNSNLAMGTGDYTIELWFYYNSARNTQNNFIFSMGSAGNFGAKLTRTNVFLSLYSTSVEYYFGGNTLTFANTFDASLLDSWQYISVSRVSGVIYYFLNGNLVGNTADSSNLNDLSTNLFVGNNSTPSSSNVFDGKISNLRIIKGTGLYTTSYSRPNTPLTNVSGTVLLMTADNPMNVVADTSSVANVVTNTGVVYEDCNGTTPMPTPTPSSTGATPTPTGTGATGTPTATPSFTPSPTPSVTPNPTATPVPAWFIWGNNQYGQAGNDSTTNISLLNVVQSANLYYQLESGNTFRFIKNGYTGWYAGLNDKGQLGNNSTVNVSSPIQMPAGTNWNYLANAAGTSAASYNFQQLWTWGDNTYGQLGNNSTVSTSSPIQIGTDQSWNYPRIGDGFITADKAGTPFMWGKNDVGQLGLSDTVNRSSPVQLGNPVGGGGWFRINISKDFAFGVSSFNGLYSWGSNAYGQLANNSTVNASSPIQLPRSGITNVALGANFGFYFADDGTKWVWGRNNRGQLGLGDIINRSSFTQVTADIQYYNLLGENFYYIDSQQRLWGVGSADNGLLLNYTTDQSSPVQLGIGYAWYEFGSVLHQNAWDSKTAFAKGSGYPQSTPSPTASPTPSGTEATPTPTPSPSPTIQPTDTPSPTPSPTPSGSVTPSPTPSPTATAMPLTCPQGAMYFNGSTVSYLSIPDSVPLNLGTGNFTIEWFQNMSSGSDANALVFSVGSSPSIKIGFGIEQPVGDPTNATMTFYENNGSAVVNTLPRSYLFGNWFHIAICRAAGVIRFFLNGQQFGFVNSTYNINFGGSSLGIGCDLNGPTNMFKGNITNFRWIKNNALYTSNFSVPSTPLSAVSGTGLLLDSLTPSTVSADTSGNSNVVTNNDVIYTACNGTTATPVPTNSPTPTVTNAITASPTQTPTSTVTPVPTGTPIPTTSATPAGPTPTPFVGPLSCPTTSNGFATFSAIFGTTWIVENENDYIVGTGDYTVELFCNPYASGSAAIYWSIGGFYFNLYSFFGSAVEPRLYYDGSNYISFPTISAASWFQNQWRHLAVTRSNGVTYMWLDGTLWGQSSTSYDMQDGVSELWIGGNANDTPFCFGGTMTNFRYLVGSAVYTQNFTPATPLANYNGTKLLLLTSTAQTINTDSSNLNKTVTSINGMIYTGCNGTTPTPTPSVTRSPTPTPSPSATPQAAFLQCPGANGSYTFAASQLEVPYNNGLTIGTSDYTIECFMYPTGFGVQGTLFAFGPYSGGISLEFVGFGAQKGIRLYNQSVGAQSLGTLTANYYNNWSHVALVRSAGVTNLYLNGAWQGSTSASYDINDTTSSLWIGSDGSLDSGVSFGGNITSFRWTKGNAIYTSNFTPPSYPLTALTGTELLLNTDSASGITTDSSGYNRTVVNDNVSFSVCPATPTPTQSPSVTPSPTPSGTSSPTPSVTPSPTPSGSTSPTPSASASPTPSNSPSPTPSPSATIATTPTPSPTAASLSTWWGWGQNTSGALSIGNTNQVTGLYNPQASDFTQICIGTAFFGLKADNTLWVCGNNASANLGLGDVILRSSMVQATGSWIRAIGNVNLSSGIKTDGTLWTWGSAGQGSAAINNASMNASTPVQEILGKTDWVTHFVGTSSQLAIDKSGKLWTVGTDSSGNQGLNTNNVNKSTFTQIGAGTDWSSTFVSNAFSAALKTNGSVYVWGLNTVGQIGDGTAISKSSPVQVVLGKTISKIVGGSAGIILLDTSGNLWGTGTNTSGQLGLNDAINRSSYTQVASGVLDACANGSNLLFIKSDNTLWGCGSGGSNLLNASLVNVSSPIMLNNTFSWQYFNSVRGTFQNQTYAYANGLPQPTPTVTASPTPTPTPSPTAFALSWWAWGPNTNGNLANGTVTNLANLSLWYGTDQYSEVGQGRTGLWKKTDGSYWVAGQNSYGKLGLGDTVNLSSMVQLPETAYATIGGILTNPGNTILIKKNGTLWTAGSNTFGTLGNNTVITQSSFVQESLGKTDWSKVVATVYTAIALDTSGRLWAVGTSPVGDGTAIARSRYVQIGTATNWTDIEASADNLYAKKNDGTWWGWGSDGGTFGINSNTSRSSPIQIGAAYNIRKLSTGGNRLLIIDSNNVGWSVGTQTNGGLVNGLTAAGSTSSWTQMLGGPWIDVWGKGDWTYLIKSDNTLWAAGSLGSGAGLSFGSITGSPVQINGTKTWLGFSNMVGMQNGGASALAVEGGLPTPTATPSPTTSPAPTATPQPSFGPLSCPYGAQDFYFSALTVPNGGDYTMGTGDFTVEWWQNSSAGSLPPAAESLDQFVFDVNNGQFSFSEYLEGPYIDPQFVTFNFYANGTTYSLYSYNIYFGGTMLYGNWFHFALVRNSGVVTLYINGLSQGTATVTANMTDSSTLYIGDVTIQSSGSFNSFRGKITNFRVVKGTAVYTSNFSVPTAPLTNVSGCTLLMQVNSAPALLTDSSSLAKTVTNVNRGTSVSYASC